MAKSSITNISTTNTFQVWFDKTNELVNLVKSDILTASLATANGDITVGNATLQGNFTANNITVDTLLRVDSISPKTGSTAVGVSAPVNITTNQVVLNKLTSTSGPRISLFNSGDTDWQVGFENSTTKKFVITNGAGTLKLDTAGNLEITGTFSGTAQTANTVTLVATNTTNATHFPTFVDTATGNRQTRTDTGFTYNPSTGILSATGFSGALTGNVTGNLTGTVTGNVTGNVTGSVTGNVTGNITIPSSGSLNASNASSVSLPPGFGIVPSGGIIMWAGASTAIPTGWRLCNGTSGTPDLRDRFVVGAGGSYAVGATGGANSVTLSVDEMPTHGHTFSGTTSTGGDHVHEEQNYESNGSGDGVGPGASCCAGAIESSGVFTKSAGTHSHTFSGTTTANGNGLPHENRPPYYALCFIMKI